MSASVARSEKILNRIAEKTNLTAPAVEWLKTTLDPFHDNPLNCTGVPDGVTGNSVVQCIKSSVTINKPVGLAAGALWKCSVVMTPFWAANASNMEFNNTFSIQNTNCLDINNSSGARLVAPVTINKAPNDYVGGFLDPFRGGIAQTTTLQTVPLSINANYTGGDYRIISQGFEVLNTTNLLNVQGLCTTWRSPVPTMDQTSGILAFGDMAPDAAEYIASGTILTIPGLPQTSNDALRLPNTKQWLAKEGCYVVAHLNDPESKVSDNKFVIPYFDFDTPGTGDRAGSMMLPYSVKGFSNLGPKLYGFREVNWGNFDVSGAFFEGLSEDTTLTINWNVYIERFPSLTESDLVVLAKPSPDYCPMAFELYKAIAMELPVGVMQKENGLGDWFRDAVSTVADVVTPVMSMIPHPAAQAAAGVGRALMSKPRQESQSSYVSEKQEHAFVSRPRLARSPVRSSRIKEEIKKEAKKEAKKEIKPFLKRSTMSVMPSAKKAHKK